MTPNSDGDGDGDGPVGVAVDHAIAGLDARQCRAFVADLWAARGFETRVDGDVVVASRRGRSVVVLVARDSRSRSTPTSGRRVDAVVAPRGGEGATATAEARGARLLTASDLREMLRYAVDPADADALCRRHLGASPSELPLPPGTRLRAVVGRLAEGGPTGETTGLVAAVALVALAAAVALAVTGAGGVPDGSGTTGAPTVTAAVGAGSVPTTAGHGTRNSPSPRTDGPTRGSGSGGDGEATVSSVPGIDAGGVTNLTALAVAHDRALGARSYTLWLDTYRPSGGVPGAPRTQRDTDVAVDGSRYLVHESVERGDDRRLVREVYYDGVDWYVADRTDEETAIRWVNGTVADAPVRPDPRSLRETLITRYLATPETNVTGRVGIGDATRYRLEGTGRPSGVAPDRITNYSFVAFVDRDGLVEKATVEFTVVTAEGTYRFRFEWTYGQFEATTVTPPAWVDRAVSASATSPSASPWNRTTETDSWSWWSLSLARRR